jgi:hypothetical protein
MKCCSFALCKFSRIPSINNEFLSWLRPTPFLAFSFSALLSVFFLFYFYCLTVLQKLKKGPINKRRNISILRHNVIFAEFHFVYTPFINSTFTCLILCMSSHINLFDIILSTPIALVHLSQRFWNVMTKTITKLVLMLINSQGDYTRELHEGIGLYVFLYWIIFTNNNSWQCFIKCNIYICSQESSPLLCRNRCAPA